MAQYGEQYGRKEEGQQGDGYGHNPLQSTNVHSGTAGHDIGGTGTAVGTGGGHGYEEGKHTGGILHRSGSSSSSSSESDGEGGRRKKKGVIGKIKEKLPGGDHGGDEHKTSATVGGGGYGHEGEEGGHEKKGFMEKIKDKLPGSH